MQPGCRVQRQPRRSARSRRSRKPPWLEGYRSRRSQSLLGRCRCKPGWHLRRAPRKQHKRRCRDRLCPCCRGQPSLCCRLQQQECLRTPRCPSQPPGKQQNGCHCCLGKACWQGPWPGGPGERRQASRGGWIRQHPEARSWASRLQQRCPAPSPSARCTTLTSHSRPCCPAQGPHPPLCHRGPSPCFPPCCRGPSLHSRPCCRCPSPVVQHYRPRNVLGR
mmetsp:Transcript_113890/g.367982  ORF Transcript_113890/g.367982 Transcript_113890/m.367982 type:complete len:220 (+) Transcript_113890:1042-1701(+)